MRRVGQRHDAEGLDDVQEARQRTARRSALQLFEARGGAVAEAPREQSRQLRVLRPHGLEGGEAEHGSRGTSISATLVDLPGSGLTGMNPASRCPRSDARTTCSVVGPSTDPTSTGSPRWTKPR